MDVSWQIERYGTREGSEVEFACMPANGVVGYRANVTMRGNIVQRGPAKQILKFANKIGIDLNLLGITRQGRSGGFDGRQRFTSTWRVETLRYWSYEQLTQR